jgi:hypothetical protein
MAKWWQKAGSIVASGARALSRNPIASTALGFVPFAGPAVNMASKALTAYGAYSAVRGAFSGGGSRGGLPALPGEVQPGPGYVTGGAPLSPFAGKRSIFRDDPNVAKDLQQYAIDNRFLKQFYRAPRGYVILRDNAGDVYALPKEIARQRGWWKPAKKPPISVRQWSAMQSVKSTMKKMNDINKVTRQLARHASMGQGGRRSIGTTNYIVEKGPGDVIQFPKRRKAA